MSCRTLSPTWRAAALMVALAAVGACQGAPTSGAPAQAASRETFAFANGGVHLSGTLVLPPNAHASPAVVLMGGNGPWLPFRWYFEVLVDSLVRRGIAVAYYDHRGEGASTGDFDAASFEELAGDAIAAVKTVAGHTGIDARQVGLWGHSMGGWIAPLAASMSADVAFVVTAAGSGVGPLEQTLFARANDDRRAGVAEPDVLALDSLRRVVVEYYVYRTNDRYASAQAAFTAARNRPWFPRAQTWPELQGVSTTLPSPETLARIDASNPTVLRWFRRDGLYDASTPLRRMSVPLLALFGDADQTVPVTASVEAMRSAFASPAKNSQLTVRVYPGANHSMMLRPEPIASALAPYVRPMADWILTVHR